jgi:hypothetical protein
MLAGNCWWAKRWEWQVNTQVLRSKQILANCPTCRTSPSPPLSAKHPIRQPIIIKPLPEQSFFGTFGVSHPSSPIPHHSSLITHLFSHYPNFFS